MSSNGEAFGNKRNELVRENETVDHVPVATPAIANESLGATTTTTSNKVESSSDGAPRTLGGDSENNRAQNESNVHTNNEMSDYFIPVEPVKPPVPQNREATVRLDDIKSGKGTEAKSEPHGGDESVGSKEETVASEIYVRPDGKKVRKIKRRSLEIDESLSVGSASVGEIYLRSDGKKVRRVKKKRPKSIEGTTADLSQPPMAPLEEDEEFAKESTVEPSDGKPSLIEAQGAEMHAEPSQCSKDFERTHSESAPAGQASNDPVVAHDEAAKSHPSKDEVMQPINDINPWMMDPVLDEEASHRSNQSMVSHRSGTSRPSVEVKNPFDVSRLVLETKAAAPDAVNPFDALLQNPSPSVPLNQGQEPPAPLIQPVVVGISPLSISNTTASRPDPGFPCSTSSKDNETKVVSHVLSKESTSSIRQNHQPIVVSDASANHYVKFEYGSPRQDVSSPHSTSGWKVADKSSNHYVNFDNDDFGQNSATSPRQDASSPQSTASRKTGSRQPLAESIMVRTRSRADPNAVVSSPPRNPRASLTIRVSADDDAFILNTALARKRIRVVQLLIVGLIGFLFGFLGNVFIQSSCHFATAKVAVGTNGQVFRLHYGLWKFTPLDSVFQGYTYCYNYHDRFTGDAPFIPRLAALSAMVLGGYSLCIVWYYLIFGDADEVYWRWCVRTAIGAGFLQFSTMFFFIDDVCRNNECALGPAGVVSLTSAIIWLILAFELWYNMPTSAWAPDIGDLVNSPDASLMGNLEMSDFEDGAKAYFRRMRPNHDLPTLNQMQRENENPIGEGMREISVSPRGTYNPPIVVDL